jgi:hypothetical protein
MIEDTKGAKQWQSNGKTMATQWQNNGNAKENKRTTNDIQSTT